MPLLLSDHFDFLTYTLPDTFSATFHMLSTSVIILDGCPVLGLPCTGCRPFLNRKCHIKTFSQLIALSQYTCSNMCNVFVGSISKDYQCFLFACCSSNVCSAFREREELPFTNMHHLEKSCITEVLLPNQIT